MRRTRNSRTESAEQSVYSLCFFLLFLCGVLQQTFLPLVWCAEAELNEVILLSSGTLFAAYLVSGAPQGLVFLPVFCTVFGAVTENLAERLVHMASDTVAYALRDFLFLAVNVPMFFIIAQWGMFVSKRQQILCRPREDRHCGRGLFLSSAFLLIGLFSAGLYCFR